MTLLERSPPIRTSFPSGEDEVPQLSTTAFLDEKRDALLSAIGFPNLSIPGRDEIIAALVGRREGRALVRNRLLSGIEIRASRAGEIILGEVYEAVGENSELLRGAIERNDVDEIRRHYANQVRIDAEIIADQDGITINDVDRAEALAIMKRSVALPQVSVYLQH